MATQTLTPTTSIEDAGDRGALGVEKEKNCYVCGDAGFKEVLAACIKCKSVFIHLYCMKTVVSIFADDWVCEDCDPSDEPIIADEATVLVSRPQFSKGKKHLASPEESSDGSEMPKQGVKDSTIITCLARLQPRGKKHLASTESSCNGVEIPKKGVTDSKYMNSLATLQPRENPSNGPLAGRKRRKNHNVQEHLPLAVREPPVKSQIHADAAKSTLEDQVILHNPEHIKRYENLQRRKICNTRYLDEELLDTLGLKGDIWWMAERVGWTQFLTMKEATYISLTLEFLSTVKTNFPQNGKLWLITFRLQNQDRQLTIEQFNSIFGFPTGKARTNPKGYHADDFWSEISDEVCFVVNKAYSCAVYNPCFRIMQQFMANTIFG